MLAITRHRLEHRAYRRQDVIAERRHGKHAAATISQLSAGSAHFQASQSPESYFAADITTCQPRVIYRLTNKAPQPLRPTKKVAE